MPQRACPTMLGNHGEALKRKLRVSPMAQGDKTHLRANSHNSLVRYEGNEDTVLFCINSSRSRQVEEYLLRKLFDSSPVIAYIQPRGGRYCIPSDLSQSP